MNRRKNREALEDWMTSYRGRRRRVKIKEMLQVHEDGNEQHGRGKIEAQE